MEQERKYKVVQQNMSLTASLVAPGEIVRALKHVQAVLEGAMTPAVIKDGKIIKDGDYGLIPGCGDKPALRKSGAEILLIAFGLVAHMRQPVFKMLENCHREVIIETEIRNGNTGTLHAIGVGSCSTMESKYRWRNFDRLCPACGKPTIIKGKAEYGGGWLCFAKRGGCGAKFKEGDGSIEGQQVGREENPDIADMWNTVLKMAAKRSAVDGAIKATASSGMFTQDIDDIPVDDPQPPSMPKDENASADRNVDRGQPQQPARQTQTKCPTTGRMKPAYCSVCKQETDCPEEKASTRHVEESVDQPIDNLSEFIAQIDKLGSVDEVMAWQDDNLQSAYKGLSGQDFEKLKQYILQISEVLRGTE